MLCDDVRVELAGKFSLMGIFDQFQVSDFQNPLPSFYIVARVEFESEGSYPLVVQLRTLEGQSIFNLSGKIQVQESTQGEKIGNIRLRIDNLRLPRPGQYEFVLLYNDESLHVLPVAVIIPPQKYVQ